jgi:hypothetical protein
LPTCLGLQALGVCVLLFAVGPPEAGAEPLHMAQTTGNRGGAAPADAGRPTEIVVTLPSSLSQSQVDELARRHRLAQVDSQRIGGTGLTSHRWRIVDRRSVADVVRALEADGSVGAAQPNHRHRLQ